MDVLSGITVINRDGNKKALAVYQPGYTSFTRDFSYAFSNGLALSDWKVEITTASSQAPSDFATYNLLVLGSPSYSGKPGDAIVRYVNRTSNLYGIDVVIIALNGVNSPGRSIEIMKQKVQAKNGSFSKSLTI